ncbi:hypothetical protein EYF80_046005 [Liparis tanakae]|uniref:Uncharacterized protein n=1 Tax=Liparis tanakae TaxID=230148 RepID=A0A4Z2FRL7_9TELE|nr:hypothetical protein EYF80_046005 [Liparis tanakae]
MTLLGVLHQGPVDSLLRLLHLSAALHRLHIYGRKQIDHTPSAAAAARTKKGLKSTKCLRQTNSCLSNWKAFSLDTKSWVLDTRLLSVTPA